VWKEPAKPKPRELNPTLTIGGQSTMTMNDMLKAVSRRRHIND
jgi:hypothetical protein